MLVYAIQYLDKSTNSTAAVMGLGEDLKMEGDDFAWSGTAFYLGYLILEFPSVYLLSTLLSSKLCLDPWGIIVALPGES
jgi:ACS family allantoate permease-like MFS transporter